MKGQARGGGQSALFRKPLRTYCRQSTPLTGAVGVSSFQRKIRMMGERLRKRTLWRKTLAKMGISETTLSLIRHANWMVLSDGVTEMAAFLCAFSPQIPKPGLVITLRKCSTKCLSRAPQTVTIIRNRDILPRTREGGSNGFVCSVPQTWLPVTTKKLNNIWTSVLMIYPYWFMPLTQDVHHRIDLQ